nr:hypothetical protein [Prauserella shujinwangii]
MARASAWSPGRPAVLRHHLLLPADRVPEATALLAPDGWDVREAGREGDRIRVHALRADRLDALLCARERARMAGLAQRLGGDALGWDALQPPG